MGEVPAYHAADVAAGAVPVPGDRHVEFVLRLRPDLCHDEWRPGARDGIADYVYLQAGIWFDAVRLRGGIDRRAVRHAAVADLDRSPRRRRQRGSDRMKLWWRHAALIVISIV